MDNFRGIKLPVFNGGAESWSLFSLKFKAVIKIIGLGHLLTIDKGYSVKEQDGKEFNRDDARVQSILLNQMLDGPDSSLPG